MPASFPLRGRKDWLQNITDEQKMQAEPCGIDFAPIDATLQAELSTLHKEKSVFRHITRITIALLGIAAFAAFGAPRAVEAQFGKNMVQYENLRGKKQIVTDHFVLYYYGQITDSTAALVATIAEETYAQYSYALDHQFEQRKHVLLYESFHHFRATNAFGYLPEGVGGVSSMFKARMAIPLFTATPYFVEVLKHELAHKFQEDIMAPKYGRDRTGMHGVAHWFAEGMANYMAVGRLDPFMDAVIRDGINSGYIRDIGEAFNSESFLSYSLGQALWQRVEEKFGGSAIGLILKATTPGEPISGFTAVGLDEKGFIAFLDEWMNDLLTTYRAHGDEYTRLSPSNFGRKITRHAFSREEKWTDSSASYNAPSISPDGRYVAYVTEVKCSEMLCHELQLADAKTGARIASLARSGEIQNFKSLRGYNSVAAWSNDGSTLAFVTEQKGRDVLVIYDVESRRVVQEFRPDVRTIESPSFAPDGDNRRVVFTGLVGGWSDLFVLDRTNGEVIRVTNDRFSELHPAWSNDGKWIAFATDRDSTDAFDHYRFVNFRIATYEVATGAIRVLGGQEYGENLNPAWSPDDATIAFVSTRSGRNNVYLQSIDRSCAYQITDVFVGVTGVTRFARTMSWSRSGALAFSAFEGRGSNVYIIDDPLSRASGSANCRNAASYVPAPVAREPLPVDIVLPVRPDTAVVPPPAPDTSRVKVDSEFYGQSWVSAPGDSASADSLKKPRAEFRMVDILGDTAYARVNADSFSFRKHKTKFEVDYVCPISIAGGGGGGGRGGLFGSGCLVMSDKYSDHLFYAAAQFNGSLTKDTRLETLYCSLPRRGDICISVAQVPYYQFIGAGISEDSATGGYSMEIGFTRTLYRQIAPRYIYPIDMFKRIEFGPMFGQISQDIIIDRCDVSYFGTNCRRSTQNIGGFVMGGASASYVVDHSIDGYLSPIANERFRIDATKMWGLDIARLNVDYRQYISLGGPQNTIALRGFSTMTVGSDSRLFQRYWGGSNWYTHGVRGYDYQSFSEEACALSSGASADSSASSCPVRDQFFGTNFLMASAELRLRGFNFFARESRSAFGQIVPLVEPFVYAEAGLAFNDFSQIRLKRSLGENPYLVRTPQIGFGFGARVPVGGMFLLTVGGAYTPTNEFRKFSLLKPRFYLTIAQFPY